MGAKYKLSPNERILKTGPGSTDAVDAKLSKAIGQAETFFKTEMEILHRSV